MNQLIRRYKNDIWVIALIIVSTFLISSFYLKGQILSTGYQDWMYHAYRGLSMQHHGLLSWDTIWDSGLSYWRGYQLFGALAAVVTATIFGVAITKAMLILTVFCFVAVHVTSYVAARIFGLRPPIALSVVGILLGMTYFWYVLGFYSTMFAAVLAPVILAVWKLSSTHTKLRPFFAACVGLSIYVHPLLAVASFGLWLISVLLDRRQLFKRYAVMELAIIGMLSFFYWYTLAFISTGVPDPYQLTNDFLYIVAAVFHFPPLLYVLGSVVLLAAILKPGIFSSYSQYLFWYVIGLYILNFLTIHNGGLSFFNRFQLYRLGFFITPVLVILFGELVQKSLPILKRKYLIAASVVIFAAGCTQAFIYTSVYGYTTSQNINDPVSLFLKNHKVPTGSIYIADSTTASYNNPNLHFSSGYNDQLLPQLINVRLSNLIGATAPNFSTNSRDIKLAGDYIKVTGVQYVFLPKNSPFVKPLQKQLGFKLIQNVAGKNFNQSVLMPPWKPTYAAFVTCSEISGLTKPVFKDIAHSSNYDAQDKAVQKAAALLYEAQSKPIRIAFPAKDSISFTVPAGQQQQCIILNQSYATGWKLDGITDLQASSYGMMLLRADPGQTRTASLHHGWGHTIQIQVVLVVIAGSLLVVRYRQEKRGEADA